TGLNWGLFDGPEPWGDICQVVGPSILSCVCRKLASNYWAWRHGLPDLFLWKRGEGVTGGEDNSEGVLSGGSGDDGYGGGQGDTGASVGQDDVQGGVKGPDGNEDHPAEVEPGACKWIEVKGPGDSLSCFQEAWIDVLVGAGADFTVLWVEDGA
ncbi:unnamed protein product, partial [Choristocarpus tenellus]